MQTTLLLFKEFYLTCSPKLSTHVNTKRPRGKPERKPDGDPQHGNARISETQKRSGWNPGARTSETQKRSGWNPDNTRARKTKHDKKSIKQQDAETRLQRKLDEAKKLLRATESKLKTAIRDNLLERSQKQHEAADRALASTRVAQDTSKAGPPIEKDHRRSLPEQEILHFSSVPT